jgi:AcrR family transcriptional regulator
MGRNPERDIREREKRKQKILEAAFPLFAKKGIDPVSMSDIAESCGISYATLYRNYGTKADLVLAINSKIWNEYFRDYYQRTDVSKLNAAEEFDFYLESYLDLYRYHRDILTFNNYFNAYILMEQTPPDRMQGFMDMVKIIADHFHGIYEKALSDGTLRTDIPENEIFTTTLHLMLAVITRYSVGLIYQNSNNEKELALQKTMLYSYYTSIKETRV